MLGLVPSVHCFSSCVTIWACVKALGQLITQPRPLVHTASVPTKTLIQSQVQAVLRELHFYPYFTDEEAGPRSPGQSEVPGP